MAGPIFVPPRNEDEYPGHETRYEYKWAPDLRDRGWLCTLCRTESKSTVWATEGHLDGNRHKNQVKTWLEAHGYDHDRWLAEKVIVKIGSPALPAWQQPGRGQPGPGQARASVGVPARDPAVAGPRVPAPIPPAPRSEPARPLEDRVVELEARVDSLTEALATLQASQRASAEAAHAGGRASQDQAPSANAGWPRWGPHHNQ